MSKITAQLPKGMRDFLPADVLRRQYVMDTVAGVFQTFGYEPLYTPVMELNETLMGKYGEDAEKLIFHAKHPQGSEELALRYDLTVPLARFFGMHESDVLLPFKRYQIAPVWRAERPLRGRFREFYQCDADTVGVAGMEADAETVNLVVTVLNKLGFEDFRVKINNRKLLTGIGQYAGLTGDALSNLYRSIDKLDKIGPDGVRAEMLKGGISEDTIDKIARLLFVASEDAAISHDGAQVKVARMRETLDSIAAAQDGLRELSELIKYLSVMNVADKYIELDFSMVRGLGYYTGPIFETVLLSDDPEERVGSISGGGRYDDLLGLFRKESLPTVGVSLGIERLITIMEKRDMYPPEINRTVVQVLVTLFNADTRPAAMKLAALLRESGVNTELYMQEAKLGKQIGYADKKGIPVIAVIGPDEMASGEVKLKRLSDQHEVITPLSLAAEAVKGLI